MTTFASLFSLTEKRTFSRQLSTPLNFGKFKGTAILNVPLYYVRWLHDNDEYLNNLFPEVITLINIKLQHLHEDIEKEDFCMEVPIKCKCGLKPRKGKSNKQIPSREFYTCSKQILNKSNGKYEGGCDFFKWGFPNSSIEDEDGYVVYI